MSSNGWQIEAGAYLARLGAAEYQAQVTKHRRGPFRYQPSQYHRALVTIFGIDSEESFNVLRRAFDAESALHDTATRYQS